MVRRFRSTRSQMEARRRQLTLWLICVAAAVLAIVG
jgi:hypothetical protein